MRMSIRETIERMVMNVKLNSAFVLRHISDKYLLVPVRKNELTSNPMALNRTAASILLLSQSCESAVELYQKACEELSIPYDENIRSGILSFIHFLLERNIIEGSD